MKISDSQQVSMDTIPGFPRDARTLEEAAEQFETVLARQLVGTMTEGLFKNNLTGEDGPSWIEGYSDTQRELLTEILASHFVKSGKLKLSQQLLKQWQAQFGPPEVQTGNASQTPAE